MTIPDEFLIRSHRTERELSRVIASGHSKNEVVQMLYDRLKYHDVDKANLWAAELVASCQSELLWSKLVAFVSQQINSQSPDLPSLMLHTHSNCQGARAQSVSNCQQSRNAIAQIVTVIALSTKRAITWERIGERDRDFEYYSAMFLSRNTDLADQVFLDGDPIALKYPVNEFLLHVTRAYRARKADRSQGLIRSGEAQLRPLYWLAWLLDWDSQMTAKKNQLLDFKCANRPSHLYADKVANDLVWLVWDALFGIANRIDSPRVSDRLSSLHGLYTMQFVRGKKRERRFLLYNAVHSITHDPEPTNVYIDRKRVLRTVAGINAVYRGVAANCTNWETTERTNTIRKYVTLANSAENEQSNRHEDDASDTDCATEVYQEVLYAGLSPMPRQPESLEDRLAAREAEYEPTSYRGVNVQSEPRKPPSGTAKAITMTCKPKITTDHIALPVSCSRGTGFCSVSRADALSRQQSYPETRAPEDYIVVTIGVPAEGAAQPSASDPNPG
ncbi:g7905 [Coccomyxa viridis]|uniref:G7905 protein n=1 Tax=Coccomyxa viridis TaxID=1274662 RepID=A0ABP1G3J1_9CHLO